MAPNVKLAKRFNPNKPFGECYGDPRFAYEQNGVVYNASLQAVTTDGKPLAMEEGPPIEREGKKGKSAAAALQVKQREIDAEDETEDEKPIDLIAWRDGRLPGILWPLLVAEIKKQLGRAPSSKVEALEMINNKWPAQEEDQEPDNDSEAA